MPEIKSHLSYITGR